MSNPITEEQRAEVLAQIASAVADFHDSLTTPGGKTDGGSQALVDYVSKNFQELQKRTETAKCQSALDAIQERVAELGNLRAYVMQLPAIKSESQAVLS